MAVHDGMHLSLGDLDALLLHTPGHSEDSISVYVPAAKALFSGDCLYRIDDDRGSYSRAYLASLERLAALEIEAIYPGHASPILVGAASFIEACLRLVRASRITD
jgi:glyoxylase-like metal-dependent hydrolase (beta-lactamase superfamily II)